MKSEWKKCKLSSQINLIGGGTPKTSVPEYWNGEIPWLSVKDFNDDNRYVYKTEKYITQTGLEHSSTTLLQKDDIIISARGTVGEMAMIPFPMAFNQSCYGIRGKENNDQTFIYYLIKNSVRKLKAITHGSVFDTITRETFDNIEVSLPPLPVQKKIAGVLKSLDDKIELNRQISKNLEEQAQSLYQNMLKNAQIKMGTISDIGTVIGGGTPSKKCSDFYTDNGIAWITPKDLSTTRAKFTSRGADDITELGYKNSSAKLMPKGTILFSSRAPIGYISIAQNQICTNQGFKSVIPNSDIGTAFVYFLLKDKISIIENRASGSTFKEATTTLMNSIECDIPDKMSLKKFNKQCNAIFSMQETLQKENQKLASLRDTLLPKLMSGEIEV